jgi:hypothetical protein
MEWSGKSRGRRPRRPDATSSFPLGVGSSLRRIRGKAPALRFIFPHIPSPLHPLFMCAESGRNERKAGALPSIRRRLEPTPSGGVLHTPYPASTHPAWGYPASRWPEGPNFGYGRTSFHNRRSSTYGTDTPLSLPGRQDIDGKVLPYRQGLYIHPYRGSMTHGYENRALRAIATHRGGRMQYAPTDGTTCGIATHRGDARYSVPGGTRAGDYPPIFLNISPRPAHGGLRAISIIDTSLSSLVHLTSFNETSLSSLVHLTSFDDTSLSSLVHLTSFDETSLSSLVHLTSFNETNQPSLVHLTSFDETNQPHTDERLVSTKLIPRNRTGEDFKRQYLTYRPSVTNLFHRYAIRPVSLS